MKTFITIVMVFVFVKGFSQQQVFVGGQYLYSLDINNCTTRFVGHGDIIFYDIAFTPDGKLWGLSNTDGLYLIDTSNASTKFIGTVSGQGISLVGLNNSVLLSEFNDTLYGINVTNAQCYKIGIISSNDTLFYATGDLSWYGNDLYMSTFNQLIKIELDNTFTSITKVTALNSTDNPIPIFLGLATITVNGTQNLIGFTENCDAYLLSPISGSFQLLCPENLGVFGAASMSFPSSLPIHLLNFTYSLFNNSVKLEWQTANEINSNYFSIERSADGINFNAIGKVVAAGTSNDLKSYYFTDNDPQPINYYRLKEVDKDGKFTYSNILLVKVPQRSNISVNPNPATDRIFINSSTPVQKIEIIDLQGIVVKTQNNINASQAVYIGNLSRGIYFLKAYSSNGIVVREFVKE